MRQQAYGERNGCPAVQELPERLKVVGVVLGTDDAIAGWLPLPLPSGLSHLSGAQSELAPQAVRPVRQHHGPEGRPFPDCKDCGKRLSVRDALRCKTCSNKARAGQKRPSTAASMRKVWQETKAPKPPRVRPGLTCPRCRGRMMREGDELLCITCGHRDYGEQLSPLEFLRRAGPRTGPRTEGVRL